MSVGFDTGFMCGMGFISIIFILIYIIRIVILRIRGYYGRPYGSIGEIYAWEGPQKWWNCLTWNERAEIYNKEEGWMIIENKDRRFFDLEIEW